MDIGIVSYGLCIPDRFETAGQVAEKSGLTLEEVKSLGIERKWIPAAVDQPIPMAVKAAKQAFNRARGIEPLEVDVVIWTGEEYKDYIAQTASIRLQEEVGCRNAWAFDLVGQGTTSILGLRVARDLMNGDDTIQTVLLAGGTRNIDLVDYSNPDTRFLLASSASGGAILLKRNHPENHLMGTSFIVDADMADAVYVPGGGTEIPFCPENLNSAVMFFSVADSGALSRYLGGRWNSALTDVIKKVMYHHHSLDYLALRHLSPADRQQVLAWLKVNPEHSMPLNEWGHHGPNDVIISLDLGIKSGAIQDGSSLVLASGGIGFTYAAALVRWGRAPS
jgi:3-oxoacyl-[acyl-carrier-protein] synthase III